jgi:hypothetical protein
MNATQMKDWLELAYYASGIAVAIIAGLGLRQIRVLKTDIKLRNERAAKERAIEYSTRYLSRYCALNSAWFDYCQKNSVPNYEGPIGNFTYASLPKKYKELLLERWKHPKWLDAINELSAIASAFTSGVADECEGFKIIGRSFCLTVEHNYDLLAAAHDRVCPYYYTIVALYQTWRPRMKEAELLDERTKIDLEIAKQTQSKIKPIGCE